MASKQKSVKLNFIMNAMLSMSSFIFPLITFPYVSRVLLPEGSGKVSLVQSVVSYFAMFAQLGIPTYGIRACAKVRDDKIALSRTAQEILIINLVMSILPYLALLGAVACVPRLRAEWRLYLIVSVTILLNAIGMEWLYRALEEYTYITVRSLVFKVVSVIAMFLLVRQESDYVIYGAISVVASVASNILNFINVRRYITLRPVGQYNFRQHLKPIWMFFAMSCAVTVYTNLDTVMLGFMKTDADVGCYNASVKIKGVLLSLTTSLSTVLLPRASYYVENDRMEEFRAIAQKALAFVVLAAVPLMAYFTIYAQEGILLLSGEAFADAVLPMQILMPTLVVIGITNVWGNQIFVPLGKENVVLRSEIAGALTDVVINLALIPRFASAGAALGTLAAEVAVLLVQYRAIRSEMNDVFAQTHFVRIVAATALASVVSLGVKGLPLGNFAALVVSAGLFFGIYGLFLLLRKEEMAVQLWKMLTAMVNKLHQNHKKA